MIAIQYDSTYSKRTIFLYIYRPMKEINVTEFRQHLPDYLKQVGRGEEIILTSHGKIIARVLPNADVAGQARDRLEALRGKMILDDIIDNGDADERWTADEDHL